MQVLVDTCIWSLALRRKTHQNDDVNELKDLILEQRVHIIGPIRQEILSDINHPQQFVQLREKLSAFPDLLIKTLDYECAAEFSNTTRRNGIQGSTIDFLICAAAYRHKMAIYTVDKDFEHFEKYLPIKLHKKK